MSFVTHEQQSLVWLASPLLGGVRHGFSTRRGGVSPAPWDTLNLGPGRGDAPENVEENYRRFFAALDMDSAYPVLSRQVHRDDVRLCTAADAGKGLIRDRDYDADALITAEKGLPLVVFSADCGILLLHDPDAGCVGAVHAGWRGCAAGIVEKTVREMVRLLGARPERILAAVGPCIGKCCFETDGDVPEAMRASALGPEAEPVSGASRAQIPCRFGGSEPSVAAPRRCRAGAYRHLRPVYRLPPRPLLVPPEDGRGPGAHRWP